MLRTTSLSTGGMTVITKTLAFSFLLLGSIGLASADYADGMRHYEQQEYRQALQEFKDLAQRGDADAQYMLGRLNEAGNGTTQDFVQAHQWYNLAAARGHQHAAEARDALAERMTDRQVAEAQQAARDWQPQETSSSQRAAQSRPDIESLSPCWTCHCYSNPDGIAAVIASGVSMRCGNCDCSVPPSAGGTVPNSIAGNRTSCR